MSDQNSSLTIRVGVSGVAAAMSDINKLAGGIAGAFSFITASFNPGALVDSIKGVLQLGSNLKALSDRTGASVSSLVAIDKALSRIGESAQSAAGLISKMQKTVSQAASGQDSQAIKDFSILGLDPKTLATQDTAQQLYTIGAAINNIANADQRAQIATDLFGKSGAELLAVFRNGQAMQMLAKGAGDFGAVMERNAGDFQDAVFNLKETGTGPQRFWAGFLDMMPVKEITDKLYSAFIDLDVVSIGQHFGGLADVIAQSFRDGKFPEMLALLIEAGFELGFAGIQKAWLALWHGLTGATAGQIYLALINAIITFGVKASQVLVDAFFYPVVALTAGLDFAWDKMKAGFVGVVNFMKTAMQDWLNDMVDQWNKSLGKLFGKQATHFSFAPSSAGPQVSFMEYWNASKDAVADSSNAVKGYLQSQLEQTRQILGVNQQLSATDNQHESAYKRLLALVDAEIAKRKELTKAENGGTSAPVITPFDTKTFIAKQEVALNEQLLKIKRELAQIDGDYTKTNAEKYAEKAALLQKEIADYQSQIDDNNGLIKNANLDGADKNALAKRNEQLMGGMTNAQDSLSKMGADPNSFSQQFQSKLTEMQNKFGTAAQQMSGTFADVFDTAINSISKGISGLIEGTMTWGKALQQIGTSILDALIQGIVKMFVTWILQMTILRLLQSLFHTQSNTEAEQSAAAWGPAAIAASIASYGAASAVGTAAAVAAMAMGSAFAAGLSGGGGSFASGGYTGAGGKYDVAGLVHRGEVIWNQDDVARGGGVAAVENLRTGGTRAGSSGHAQIHVNLFDDPAKITKHIRDNPDAQHVILDTMGRNISRYLPRA